MCSTSYVHTIDVPAHIQAARYLLEYGQNAIARATATEDCPQYRQRVVDSIRMAQAISGTR